jgi:hypothetical protein
MIPAPESAALEQEQDQRGEQSKRGRGAVNDDQAFDGGVVHGASPRSDTGIVIVLSPVGLPQYRNLGRFTT